MSAPGAAWFAGRSFLLLQGPNGPFFRTLGAALKARGAGVLQVNFCGGDLLRRPRRGAISFRGRRVDWPAWVAKLMDAQGVTDLVFTGDLRPLHIDAAAVAKARGILVHVFEEGYLRPNHITLEQDGVNTRGRLPAAPEAVRRRAAELPPAQPVRPIADSLKTRVYDTIVHHVGNFFLFGMFPRHRTHRPYTIGWELLGLIPRRLARSARIRKAEALQAALLDSPAPFFLFPLQLDADAQVRSHAHHGVLQTIAEVLASFAAHAPAHVRLIVKNHPLDNGLIALERYVGSLAAGLGLTDRVAFLDGGDGRTLLTHPASQGVVVVNSTMGLAALDAGRPVYTLAPSVYSMPGLAVDARESTLDAFWQSPRKPDRALLDDFVKVLLNDVLTPGNFHTPAGIEAAVLGSLTRFAKAAP